MASYVLSCGPEPIKGQIVRGRCYVWSCLPGAPPLFDYTFSGIYLGVCADGFMVRPVSRSDGNTSGETIFARDLTD